jgi:hypothetical protein
LLTLLTLLVGVTASASAPVLHTPYVQSDEWVAEAGDRMIVDTELNWGYLMKPDGRYTAFPVGTGQRRTVRFIGKTYNATTPVAQWTARSLEIKSGDRATYGNTGRFFRLHHERWGRTQYGIHATSNIEDILAMDDRFRSYGCILVSDAMLDILEYTFHLNEGSLDVRTARGVDIMALSMEASMPL